MIWLVLAAAGVAGTAALGASALRIASPVSYLLAAYLLASAEVIALTEVLSLLGSIGAAGYAIGEALLLGAAAAAWHLRGRPRPPLCRLPLRAGGRAHPIVAALALVVGLAVVYQGVLVFSTPPNNWDSMSYHLSRAAAWYQHHRIDYVSSHTERENAFQPNSEIEILYTFVLAGRDTAAAATQLLAELAVLLGVYGCARRLGFRRPDALFASLLTATLTEIALQSVTTQNDLVATSFAVAAACLAFGETRTELALAGLAAGLALGTKATTAPALALVALLALTRRSWRPRLATLAAASAIGFGAVGFYGYGLNLVHTGTLLGDPVAQANTQPDRVTFGGTVSTTARLGFRFFDFSGYSPPGWLRTSVDAVGRHVFSALAIPANPPEATQAPFFFSANARVNEDISFFGPLGFLLVLPLSAGFLVAGALRRAPPRAAVLGAALPLFVLAIAVGFKYNPWLGRFLILPVALTMPLAGTVYRKSRPIAALLAIVGAIGLYLAHTKNEAKPAGLDGRTAVWDLSRAEVQTLARPELLEVYGRLEREVPANATLGTVLRFDDWDYPLYGPSLRRRLQRVPQEGMLEYAERHGIRWILLDPDAVRPRPRASWTSIDFQGNRWTMYVRSA